MLILPYPHLWGDIERYCKILGKTVVLPLEPEAEYSLSSEMSLTKEAYSQKKQELEDHILQLFGEVNSVAHLSIALFIFRSVIKQKMYEDSFEEWTHIFKICNYLFFLSLKLPKHNKRSIHLVSDDSLTVKKIFFCGYTFFYNQSLFNEHFFSPHKVSIDRFYQRIEQVSSKIGDMHSYQITNSYLREYLDIQSLTVEQIQKYAFKKYKDHFLSRKALQKNTSWQAIILRDNKGHPYDDIVIVPAHTFYHYDRQFQEFISSFEAKKCHNPADAESDLIFAYKTDDYIYISKKLLYDTQAALESFLTWGQYESITQYFWGMRVDRKILRNYNRLMTYKIVDLLLANGYVIPMQTVNGKPIPRIEISNYTTDKRLAKKLGDIDSMFFSEHTNTLYLIEYKNYQMLVSRELDLSAELSKVEKDDAPEKVRKRHEYIVDHIAHSHCIDTLFQSHRDVQKVKSIILTTKPCCFFYIYESQKYDYMDWVEFEQKVLNKKL